MPALDRYDPDMVDDEQYSEMSQGERAVAETAMLKRDREAGIIRDDRYLLYGILRSIKINVLFKTYYNIRVYAFKMKATRTKYKRERGVWLKKLQLVKSRTQKRVSHPVPCCIMQYVIQQHNLLFHFR